MASSTFDTGARPNGTFDQRPVPLKYALARQSMLETADHDIVLSATWCVTQ
jgi:type IV secretory pathway TrbD component